MPEYKGFLRIVYGLDTSVTYGSPARIVGEQDEF